MAFGAGFALGEASARASSMGNAVVAQAYDAGTLFYNPSGIGFLTGTHFNGSFMAIAPKAKFVRANFEGSAGDPTIHEAVDQVFPPVGLYVSHRLNDKFAFGLSFSTPFGLGFKWEDDFPGRFISKEVDLQSFYLTPVVAVMPTKELSLAVGLDVVFSNVLLRRNLLAFSTDTNPGTDVGETELKGSSMGKIGFNVSAMYQTKRLGLGVAYRHSVKNEYDEADVNFTLYDTPFKTLVTGGLTANGTYGLAMSGSAEITFPASVNAGIYYKLADNLGVEVDFLYTFWNVFDEIPLNFENDALSQVIPEDYEDAFQLRLGAQYDVNDALALRAGYIYDQTPQPIHSVSPLLPDNDRNDFTAGIGYKTGNLTVDAGFMFVNTGKRSTLENGVGQNENGFNGTYSANATLFFVGLGYHLQ